MKTKELIKELNEIDPSGNLEVTVGKIPIHFVERLPSYYDGKLQILMHDPKKAPYYDICGGVITDKGQHVCIHMLSIQDAIYEDPELKVILDLSSPERNAEYRDTVEDWRGRARDVKEEVEKWKKEQGIKDS